MENEIVEIEVESYEKILEVLKELPEGITKCMSYIDKEKYSYASFVLGILVSEIYKVIEKFEVKEEQDEGEYETEEEDS